MHEIIKIIASYLIIVPVIALVAVFWRLPRAERVQYSVFIIVGAALTLILAKLGSHFYYDPRPFMSDHVTPLLSHSSGNGFPSDHTLLSAFAAFVVMRYSRPAAAGLLVVALLIGGSRVLAGVHHGRDIAGSFVFAAVGTWLGYWLTKYYFSRASQSSAKPEAPETT